MRRPALCYLEWDHRGDLFESQPIRVLFQNWTLENCHSHQAVPGGTDTLDSRAAPEKGKLCMDSSSCSVTTEISLLHWFLSYWAGACLFCRQLHCIFGNCDFSDLPLRKLTLEKLRKKLQLTFKQRGFELCECTYVWILLSKYSVPFMSPGFVSTIQTTSD